MALPVLPPIPPVCARARGCFGRARVSYLCALGFAAGWALTPPGLTAAEVEEPWREIALHRFKEARVAFVETAPGSRESMLGEAVALLNLQPRTEQNIRQAAVQLEAVAAADGRDDLGLTARYVRARIDQLHLAQSQPDQAVEQYRALLRDAPARHPLAAQAAVKLALLTLYHPTDPRRPAERLAELEQMTETVAQGAARRDLHLLLGRGYLFFDLEPARALFHLEAAWAARVVNRANRADTLLAIAQLSGKHGDPARTMEAYTQFLTENPHDDRAYGVRRWLAGERPEDQP